MLRKTLLTLFALCALGLLGCYKSETMTNNSNSTAGNANKSASAPSTASSSTTRVEKIGVPECDDFIAKYDACVTEKVPEAVRTQYKTSLAQWRKSWHDLAANPQTKGALVATCKQIAEQQKKAMQSFKCTF